MDLSVVYSKTPKGLRARASLIGGLSSHLMKVLTHVDGNSKAETILLKFDHLTPQQLSADITRLVQEGYIRLATVTAASDGGWALTTNFAPMVVEEYQSEEELEATTQAKIQEQARLAAEQQAKQEQEAVKREQEARLAAEQKMNKKAEKLRAKEKSKAESKVKAQLAEEQRVARAAEAARELAKEAELAAKLAEEVAQKKAEAEAKLIAEQAKIKAQVEADKIAKEAEEARQKAELKAREVAEQAQAQAEQQAKEDAHREIDRIAKEAEDAQRKQAVENKAKLEAERIEALRVAEAETKLEQARLQAEQERIEAERKLIEQAEQAKIRAEAAAKAEADAKQKEKLEQAAKTQAKESARLEIASIVRKAEEDRKKAAAKAKEEKLEAKRKAKAEQEAHIKAERKQKETTKEQAKAEKEAAEKTRLEILQLAEEAEHKEKKLAERTSVDAEESTKRQAENQALEKLKQERQEYKSQQAADGIRAKAEAEEQAQIEAKENARLEMERIGREAEAVRQKQLIEQHKVEQHQAEHKKSLPKLDDFDAAEAAEEAIFEAEERAAEAEKKIPRDVEKTSLQAKEDADRAEIKQTAQTDAAHRQKLQASTQSHHSAKYVKKLTSMLAKLMLVYLPIVLILVIGLLHFVNISMLIKPIEKVATETVGLPVTVTKVHASVWPQPHLVLEGVTMSTDGGNQKIEAIHVLPVVSSLFEDVKIVKSLVIEGLNVQQANFGQALTWIDKVGTAKNLKLEQVNLKNLTFNIQDLQLEPFDGQLIFTELHALKNIDLVSSSNALFVMISPQAGSYDISLKAANWALPFNPKIIFNALDAKGTISQTQIEFSQITGEMFGGNLTASTIITWPGNLTSNSQWSTTGSFSLTKVDTPLLLTTFSSTVSIDGKLNLNGSFASQSVAASQLTNAANIAANFDISQGSIGDIELSRAVLTRGGQSLAGDATSFDHLTGTVKINQGQYQYAKLALASPQFRANGYLNISANQDVSGRINADLAAQSRSLHANFAITGRGKDLKSN